MSRHARNRAIAHDRRCDALQPLVWMLAVAAFIALCGFASYAMHPDTAFGYPVRVTRWTPTIRAAARYYHLTPSDTRWAVAKGLGIIDRESGGSSTARNGSCVGLFQFNAGWKRHITIGGRHYADFRKSGRASCFRFVRVYKVGGRRAIRRHWRVSY